MESFVWGEHFITGLPLVDAQHRRLIDILNRFGTSLAENRIINKDVEHIFNELTDYTCHHFRDEEALMSSRRVDPRHTRVHIAEHKNFLRDASYLIQNISCDKTGSSEPLLAFLIQWVAHHILGADQKMTRQIRFIEDGLPPAEAYDEEEKKESAPTKALLTALNNLYQQVSKRNRELIELNQSLEEKIADRTRQLREANSHLEALSLTDALTELPNRRYALQQLKVLWEAAAGKNTHFGCMMVDADRFKEINDTFGHDAGDRVLVQLSKELRYSVRNDDMVCRLGGDEFLIICPDTDLHGLLCLGEQIRQKVAALRIRAGKGTWYGSISVGVAVNRPGMTHMDHLLKAADDGVYLAKSAGKNCVRTRQGNHG